MTKRRCGSEGRQSLGRDRIVGERLLAEHRNLAPEQLLDNGSVCRRRRCDDGAVKGRQRGDVRNDCGGAPFLGARDAFPRAGDDRNVTAERDEVAQDVAPPVPTPDEPYDHAWTPRSSR